MSYGILKLLFLAAGILDEITGPEQRKAATIMQQ